MADVSSACRTTLSGEAMLARAVEVFSSHGWQIQVLSTGLLMMMAKSPVPVWLKVSTTVGFFIFIIPGLLLYWFAVCPTRRELNVVVETSSIEGGAAVTVFYSKSIRKVVDVFMDSLPILTAQLSLESE